MNHQSNSLLCKTIMQSRIINRKTYQPTWYIIFSHKCRMLKRSKWLARQRIEPTISGIREKHVTTKPRNVFDNCRKNYKIDNRKKYMINHIKSVFNTENGRLNWMRFVQHISLFKSQNCLFLKTPSNLFFHVP